MKHKCAIVLLLLAAFFCAFAVGCAARPGSESTEENPVSSVTEGTGEEAAAPTVWLPSGSNSELERLNYDLDYTTSYYDYPNALYADSYDTETFHNLTNTQVFSGEQEGVAIGWKILSDTDELAAFEQSIHAVEDAYSEQLRQQRPGEESSYTLVNMTRKTAGTEYTEEFFRDNALLLIDLCVWSAPSARFYPENLEVRGDTASLDILWDRSDALVGSSSGQFCLIVIPADCTTAELNIRWTPADK